VQCYSAEQLLISFDIDETSGVSRTDFHRLCPALVQQATSCHLPTPTTAPTNGTNDTDTEPPSNAEGTVAYNRAANINYSILLSVYNY